MILGLISKKEHERILKEEIHKRERIEQELMQERQNRAKIIGEAIKKELSIIEENNGHKLEEEKVKIESTYTVKLEEEKEILKKKLDSILIENEKSIQCQVQLLLFEEQAKVNEHADRKILRIKNQLERQKREFIEEKRVLVEIIKRFMKAGDRLYHRASNIDNTSESLGEVEVRDIYNTHITCITKNGIKPFAVDLFGKLLSADANTMNKQKKIREEKDEKQYCVPREYWPEKNLGASPILYSSYD